MLSKSRGCVTLQDSNFRTAPKIHFNYMSGKDDFSIFRRLFGPREKYFSNPSLIRIGALRSAQVKIGTAMQNWMHLLEKTPKAHTILVGLAGWALIVTLSLTPAVRSMG